MCCVLYNYVGILLVLRYTLDRDFYFFSCQTRQQLRDKQQNNNKIKVLVQSQHYLDHYIII